MKIERVINTNLEKIYNNNKRTIEETKKLRNTDAIEISKAAKNMSAITNDNYIDSEKRAAEVKQRIENGTYSVEARKLAAKFRQIMKGSEV